MAKVLYLITSGDDSPMKFEIAITSALRAIENKRYEDVKVIFFGPSQSYLVKAPDYVKKNVEKLISIGAVGSACTAVSERLNIKDSLQSMGIRLHPVGERIALYVNNGYEVLTF